MLQIENDSDIVSVEGRARFRDILFGHKVEDPKRGQMVVFVNCPRTRKRYKHIIRCPNKYTITCRGCGKRIDD